jgi:hypothetical protein
MKTKEPVLERLVMKLKYIDEQAEIIRLTDETIGIEFFLSRN